MMPNDLNSNFSLGTTPIMNTLLHVLHDYGEPPDTIVINVDTIVRNCGSNAEVSQYRKYEMANDIVPSRSLRELVANSQTEIQNILQEIIAMYSELPKIVNPTVILYLGNYAPFIAPLQCRKVAPSKMVCSLASQQLQSAVTSRLEQKVGRITIIQLPKDNTQLPYKTLAKEVNGLTNEHRVAMVSNHPLDYHLAKSCSDFMMINSYTGEVLEIGDIPTKVFGSNTFPFNTITHALLGDKEDISSALKPKEKKSLADIAAREAWMCFLEEEVAKRCNDLGIIIPFKI